MQRFGGASPVSSPARTNFAKPSPLSRVTEEGAAPTKLQTTFAKQDNLVEVGTPRQSEEHAVKSPKSPEAKRALESLLEPISLNDDNDTPKTLEPTKAPALTNGNAKKATVEDDMKTIEI